MPLLTMREAIERTGLSRSALLRAEAEGRLRFERVQGRLFVDEDQLMSSAILTVGKAGALIGVGWRTMKAWKDAGKLEVVYEPHCKGRVTLYEVERIIAFREKQGRSRHNEP
jgi:predicted site-specific integrase-resolvase